MQTLSSILDLLEGRIEKLITRFKNLQTENHILWEENRKLKATLRTQNKRLRKVEDKLKETQSRFEIYCNSESKDSIKFKQEFHNYLKNVDECIKWLK